MRFFFCAQLLPVFRQNEEMQPRSVAAGGESLNRSLTSPAVPKLLGEQNVHCFSQYVRCDKFVVWNNAFNKPNLVATACAIIWPK